MADRADVCVLLPTYNEAATVGDVVDGFRDRGFGAVVVIDGHSTDDTRAIARDRGATVVEQSGRGQGAGKGQAVREGIQYVDEETDCEYVLLLDADGTYRPEDADALLDPLLEGRVEHVVGNRFADMEPGAMTRLNKFGNRLMNPLFRLIHGGDVRDILSGYRAFTVESARRMNLNADGFGIETEMAVECARQGIPTTTVPITYRPRPDGSSTNLHPVRDGGRILLTMYLRTKTSNPLVYFGAAGAVSLAGGLGLAGYVVLEWFTRRVGHEVLAVGAAAGILFGVQLLMFGLLSDLIVTLHREQMNRLERESE